MRIGLLFVAIFALCVTAKGGVDQDVFLRALSEIETGGDHARIGHHGERSAFQMKRMVWKKYTSRPFVEATTNPELARDIALRHMYFLAVELEKMHKPVTAYNLAVAWNGGLGIVARRTPPRDTRDYARRLDNLYREYDRPRMKPIKISVEQS